MSRGQNPRLINQSRATNIEVLRFFQYRRLKMQIFIDPISPLLYCVNPTCQGHSENSAWPSLPLSKPFLPHWTLLGVGRMPTGAALSDIKCKVLFDFISFLKSFTWDEAADIMIRETAVGVGGPATGINKPLLQFYATIPRKFAFRKPLPELGNWWIKTDNTTGLHSLFSRLSFHQARLYQKC